MPGSAPARAIIRFASFEVDPRAGEVRKNGVLVKVQELPFRALVLLLERPGQVVTREELRQALWPADIFVDFEHGISSTISRLRDSLGDSAENSRFIQTVGRRGYRWIAPLTASAPSTPASPAAIEDSPRPPASAVRPKRWLIVAAAAALVVLSAATILRSRLGPREAPIRSLAVLPLQNLSGNPENEYLADGMTDELITDLAKLNISRVISHTSVMRFKGTHKPLPEIARELNVDAVLEGTIQSSNGRLHVSAQLVQAEPEKHIWAESYDRSAEDAVTLEAELAREIAGAVHVGLRPQEQAHLNRRISPEAYQLYLKGRYFWNKRTEEGLKTGIQYFDQAIGNQPDYAEAYSGLSDCYVLLGGYGFMPQSDAVPKGIAAAKKALQLDDTLAEAYTSLALATPNQDWNWEDARKYYERALQLNPNYATAHHWYADGYLIVMGRVGEALAELRKAQQLDPLSLIIGTDIGKDLFFARRYDDAMTQLKQVLELDPHFSSAHYWLKDVYIEKGMYTEAFSETAALASSPMVYSQSLAYLYARAGRKNDAHNEVLKLVKKYGREYFDPGGIAVIYVALGENDEAFAWLERAYALKTAYMSSLKVAPAYDPLRSDPRFADLMHRVGLA